MSKSSTSDTVSIRQAVSSDAVAVGSVLLEAAEWLRSSGMAMWRDSELEADAIEADVRAGRFWMATVDGQPAGVIRFDLADDRFWPDVPDGDAAYLHRLAVRRAAAGGHVSTALIEWAAGHAAAIGRHHLRLDCEASRTKLRAFYERLGFRHHSDRRVGPYFVSRYQRLLPPQSTSS